MTTARNGSPDDSERRLRIDARPGPALARTYSGRRFVAAAVLLILAVWGGLYLVFRDWRERVRERAAYGTREVVAAIEPLAEVVPEGVDPPDWRQAVSETGAMLVRLTSSNLLDLKQMDDLRDDLRQRVARARARPWTARAELAAVWDDMAARAGPVVDRLPRPAILLKRGRSAAEHAEGAERRSEKQSQE